jgi:thioredoxin-like negative regulator of GroEL
MELERDEFVVTYDPSGVTIEELIATSEKTGFPATVLDDAPPSEIPRFFQDALARANRERKPLVVDFTASWCQPCQKMLRETFPNPLVGNLLDERCVLVTVDTDEHPGLAQKYNVVGLPDIRFLTPDGEEVQRQRDFQDAEAFATTLETFLGQVAASEQADDLIDISEGERNIRDIFNRDSEHVRLLLILSPT